MFDTWQAIGRTLCVGIVALSASLASAQNDAPVGAAAGARDASDPRGETLTATVRSRDAARRTAAADVRLAAEVRKAIFDDMTLSKAGHEVRLVAANGIVRLRGTVRNDTEKARIVLIAHGVNGVDVVDDQLVVQAD